MSALNPDQLSKRHQREISLLKRSGRRVNILRLAVFLISISIIITVVPLFWGKEEISRDARKAQKSLEESQIGWAEIFINRRQAYETWLFRYGTAIDRRAFQAIADWASTSAATSLVDGTDLGFLGRARVSFLSAVLRVSFLILACWRLWLLAMAGALAWSHSKFKPYENPDLLGRTGIGSLFYSGIRASLDDIDSQGRPRTLVPGLACPNRVSDTAAKTSELAKLLDKHGALTRTNLDLSAIILAHERWPAYVTSKEEQPQLDRTFSPVSLVENVLELLRSSFEARELCGADSPDPGPVPEAPARPLLPSEYAGALRYHMLRVLTPKLKKEVAATDSATIATIVLALEAGKVLAYAFEGGRWLQRSSFPQLCSRAILHSIPALPSDYALDERNDIRQAIIYASRKSSFAPVVFPVSMGARARALRQWTELLMACPHELAVRADEVELLGLTTEAHRLWSDGFFSAVAAMSPEVTEKAFVCGANLILLPFETVLRTFKSAVEPATIARLQTLCTIVSQSQRLESMSSQNDSRSHREVILAPLSFQEMKDLSALHKIGMPELQEWSALRIVLNSFSWLARRVGDNTVPLSSIILAVLKVEPGTPGANNLNLVGLKAMVPLRSGRLADRLGRSWDSRFARAISASMAETQEDFDSLLHGVQTGAPEEVDKDTVTA